MGNLVVTEFITLDGVFEAPGGGKAFEQGGWPSSSTAARMATTSRSTN